MSPSKLIARSYRRARHRKARRSMLGHRLPGDSRAIHGGVERLDSVHVGDERGRRCVPAADHQIDSRCGRMLADERDRVEGHHEVADALETQEENAARRRLGLPGRATHHDRRGNAEREIGEADNRSLARCLDLQVFEHRGLARVGHGARGTVSSAIRSIMTPTSRGSGTPSASPGFHVRVAMRSRPGSSRVASSAASSGSSSKR